jgi:hypothetical protein
VTHLWADLQRDRASVHRAGVYFTTLLPGAPKILLSAEIRSFGLLTSEGTAVVVSDMTSVREEVLPARFGGTIPLHLARHAEHGERPSSGAPGASWPN